MSSGVTPPKQVSNQSCSHDDWNEDDSLNICNVVSSSLDDSSSELDSTPQATETQDEDNFNSSSDNGKPEEGLLIIVVRIVIILKLSVGLMEEIGKECKSTEEEDNNQSDQHKGTLLQNEQINQGNDEGDTSSD